MVEIEDKAEQVDKIARILDVSRPTIDRWLAGQARPHKAIIPGLLMALNKMGSKSQVTRLRSQLGDND